MSDITLLQFNTQTEGETLAAGFAGLSGWSTQTAGAVAATFQAAAAIKSTRGLVYTDLTVTQWARYTGSVGVANQVLSFYFKITTMPGANWYIAEHTDTSGTKLCDLRINPPSGGLSSISIRKVNTAVATSSAVLAVNTVYRLEYQCSTTAQEAKVFVGDDNTSPIIDITGTIGGTQPMAAEVGCIAAVTGGGAGVFDLYRLSTTWPGPFNAAPPPTSYEGYYLKGGVWLPTTLNRISA